MTAVSTRGEPSPGGLRERKRRQARDAVRRAAWTLFQERGFDDVNVEDIVEAADVSRTTFFNYFASKEAVLLEPAEDLRAVQLAVLSARPEGERFWDSCSAVLLSMLEHTEDVLAVLRAVAGTSPNLRSPVLRMTEDVMAELAAWGQQRLPADEQPQIHLQVSVAVATASAAVAQWAPEESLEQLLATCEAWLTQVGRAFK
jgi:AcrR family transcriptional regulator